MKFVNGKRGSFYALSEVVRWDHREITYHDSGRTAHEWFIVLRDGSEVMVYDRPEDFHEVVPSSPGFHVLGYWLDKDRRPAGLLRVPIVAWRIDGRRSEPICLDDFDEEYTAIEYPSGEVVIPYYCVYDDADSWLRSQQEEFDKKAREVS